MVSVLILSHGGLAAELLKAAETIAGGVPQGMTAVCLDWEDSFEEARQRTSRAVQELDPRDGLLILTDMYGGTPFNVALSFVDSKSVQVLAGVNLPMVLRLCCMGSARMNPEELVAWIEEKGRRSICHSNGTLETAADPRDCEEADRKPK
ncbi:MAG: PTS sugar transporter subunit IIA [Acidobacteriota bacterium]|nr:PTS sugar transporter subunit IIA [Acidobacteriota bacterium]